MICRACTYLLIVLIISTTHLGCENAKRDGVTLTPRNYPTNELTEPNSIPKAIINGLTYCLTMDQEDYLRADQPSKMSAMDCIVETPHQGWFFTDQQEIVSPNGQCLTLNNTTDNTYIVNGQPCNRSENQKWQYNSQLLTIQNELNINYCLEVKAPTNNQNLYDIDFIKCNNRENQQWQFVKLNRVRISNYLIPEYSIHIEPINGAPSLAATRAPDTWWSAQWTLEPTGPYFRIRNFWQPNQFLHIENGVLESSPISHLWKSAEWILVKQKIDETEYYTFNNALKNDLYIGLDENKDLKCSTLSNLQDGSTLWSLANIYY
jgi:hypothetical protein